MLITAVAQVKWAVKTCFYYQKATEVESLPWYKHEVFLSHFINLESSCACSASVLKGWIIIRIT